MSKDSGGKRRSRSSSGGGGKTSTSGRSRSQSARFETCSYSLVVRTSAEKGAGADANVFVQLTDSEGNQTDKCRLKCSITHRKKFRRGHADLFLLVDQNILNDVQTVDVWFEPRPHGQGGGGGRRPGWLLHSVNVVEHAEHKLFTFPCGQWLGRALEPGQRRAHLQLQVAGPPRPTLRAEDFQITS